MSWYLTVLKKYAVFSGRARRKEYWMFVLFNIIFGIVAMILDNVIGTTIQPLPYGYIYCIYMLAVFLPSLGVLIRRLHDLNKSGWWVFISFIPIVGPIWLLILLCMAGNPGDNKYGPDPKGFATEAA